MNKNMQTLFSRLQKKLDKSQKIFITMSPPDGDAVGSALALYNEFKKLGKDVVVQSSFEMPKFLTFLPFVSHIVIDDVGKVDFSNIDMSIIVDGGDATRVVKYSNYKDGWRFPDGNFIVCFDHHSTHDEKFADIDIVDVNYASTCQLVADYFKFTGIEPDADSATLLYTGMYTDTGGFIHSNATGDVYRSAGEILDKKADKQNVILNLEKSQSLNSMMLVADSLKTMEVIQEDEFSYVMLKLTQDVLSKYDMEDIEDAMNMLKSTPGFMRNVEGTDFGVIFSQNKDVVGVSFRARTEKYNLAQICERYGGGGHKNACGFKSRESMDDLTDSVKEQIRIMLA